MPNFMLKITALPLFHCLFLAVINDVSLTIWGKPRGVDLGITMHYVWISLSLVGLSLIFLFCVLGPKVAFVTSMALISLVAFILFPGFVSPVYFSVIFASLIFFLFYWRVAERRFV